MYRHIFFQLRIMARVSSASWRDTHASLLFLFVFPSPILVVIVVMVDGRVDSCIRLCVDAEASAGIKWFALQKIDAIVCLVHDPIFFFRFERL